MPPTIQNGAANQRTAARPTEKRVELICKVKYCNTLPDITFDPKFIAYPFSSTRFIQYNPTTLERNNKYEVLTEHDLGVEIDLINKDIYIGDPNALLHPDDEKLLEEDVLTPQDSKRSRHHAKSVSWLRRTEYISTEQTRFQPQTTSDKVEAKVGHNIKKHFKEDTLYMDRESQIRAIEKTFEDNKKPIEKHYSKPGVYAVEVFQVYPDFKLWKYPCAQVIFDSDPAPAGLSVPAQIEEMSQAMIRGVMDESGEQFVAYFLPLEETLEKRKRDFCNDIEYAEEEEYEYKMAREYNWNVKNKASKGYEENYFFVVREDGVYYNELETRVRLSKRRQKVGQPVSTTKLVVKHRTMTAPEFRMQRYREKQLERPCDEEEEEEEEEDEEEEQEEMKTQEDKNEEEKDGSDNEQNGETRENGEEGSRASSRASSRATSKSRSRSPSKARSTRSARSSRSARSQSKSQSRSRSRSGSGSRSRSDSPAKSQSRSRSGSPAARSGSGSLARSGSGSPARSGSGSPARSVASKSSAKSKSKSKSRSRSRSAGSASGSEGSASGSGSGSGSGSESGTDSE